MLVGQNLLLKLNFLNKLFFHIHSCNTISTVLFYPKLCFYHQPKFEHNHEATLFLKVPIRDVELLQKKARKLDDNFQKLLRTF